MPANPTAAIKNEPVKSPVINDKKLMKQSTTDNAETTTFKPHMEAAGHRNAKKKNTT